MCGIIGGNLPELCPHETFSRMVNGLQHRGPDARGEFRNDQVLLGHRRLSILDLSDRGAQPMSNDDGSIVVVYNGECYNHLELRKMLPDVRWRSDCDTETLLRLYEKLGSDFIQHVVGMFALAIYDKNAGKLLIYRDRLGEKPLYFHWADGLLFFSSEIEPLLLHPGIKREIEPRALEEFFLFNYIPSPISICRNIRKIPPGNLMIYSWKSGTLETKSFWTPLAEMQKPKLQISRKDAADRLEQLVLEAVKGQALSDVPLGCFLSGGIDSSLVAAALQKTVGGVKTFNIGFAESEYDESPHARRIAHHLGTDHHEERLTEERCLEMLPRMTSVYGEPFADASALPTMLLCEYVKKHVTVALSGDGGDELFLGYDRYQWAETVRRRTAWLPNRFRLGVASALAKVPHYRTQMKANAMRFRDASDVYPYIFIGWNIPHVSRLLRRSTYCHTDRFFTGHSREAGFGYGERSGYSDLTHYLPDDILVKVDRAAMSYSLETRVPLLDHRIVEFALQLPEELKMNQREQKIVLKDVLYRHVPRTFFERPKAGFAVPLRKWFRGRLRRDLEESLAPEELRRHGFFDEQYVQLLLKRHFGGRWNYERQLFALFVFQQWYRKNFP